MNVDILVAEIGSTTTVVNAFAGIFDESAEPLFIGQGISPTTVEEGDVSRGLDAAVADLSLRLEKGALRWGRFLATSSAAGGLRMTVHGLVYDMTARAAMEAALGAGANIDLVTAGKLTEGDLRRLREIRPNIIMIAGGVEWGERETALHNARVLAELDLSSPVIYGGNSQNHDEIRRVFRRNGKRLYIVDNVYPKIDRLEVGPARKVIQAVFEEHIIHAAGMEKVRVFVDGPILPTPGAVMHAALLLYEDLGDLAVLDIGGATTDVHSVTEGSEEIGRILVNPEPKAKRTVEGDLGVYVNRMNLVDLVGARELADRIGEGGKDGRALAETLGRIPGTEMERRIVCELAREAASRGIRRHAGRIRDLFGPGGKSLIAEGKDLSALTHLIGTGGVLTRLPCGKEIIESVLALSRGRDLLPPPGTETLIDRDYIMASAGVLSREFPEKARRLLLKSLGHGE